MNEMIRTSIEVGQDEIAEWEAASVPAVGELVGTVDGIYEVVSRFWSVDFVRLKDFHERPLSCTLTCRQIDKEANKTLTDKGTVILPKTATVWSRHYYNPAVNNYFAASSVNPIDRLLSDDHFKGTESVWLGPAFMTKYELSEMILEEKMPKWFGGGDENLTNRREK